MPEMPKFSSPELQPQKAQDPPPISRNTNDPNFLRYNVLGFHDIDVLHFNIPNVCELIRKIYLDELVALGYPHDILEFDFHNCDKDQEFQNTVWDI